MIVYSRRNTKIVFKNLINNLIHQSSRIHTDMQYVTKVCWKENIPPYYEKISIFKLYRAEWSK